MTTELDGANWAIKAALHHAIDLGSLETLDAMAVLLKVAASLCEEDQEIAIADPAWDLLEVSGLRQRLDSLLCSQGKDRKGLEWMAEGIYCSLSGSTKDGALFLLNAAAAIAATEEEVAATMPGLSLEKQMEFMGRTAQERVIQKAILALVEKVEALLLPTA